MENVSADQDNKALQFIEKVTSNADEVQSQVLSEIVSANAHSHYLTRFPLNGRTDRSSFKKCLPVISYEDVEEDILRIANGDTSPILSANPISEFLTSSGTSGGERKLIPMTEDELERRTFLSTLLMPIIKQYMQGLDKEKGMYFLFLREEYKTPGGLPARSMLTSFSTSRYFRDMPRDTYNTITSPVETILCLDGDQSMYSMFSFSVDYSTLMRVTASFRLASHPNGILDAMEMLRESDQNSHGKESSDAYGPTPMSLFASLPRCSTLFSPTLICSRFASLPRCSTLFSPTLHIEFLSVNNCNDQAPTSKINGAEEAEDLIDLVVVKVGQEYEIVVTTYAGLYRYKVGDVLRVMEFHNAWPQFHFVRRKNVVLNIDSEKIDEVELQNALEKGVKHVEPLGGILVEYTSHAAISTIPAHYVLFWELHFAKAMPTTSIMEECSILNFFLCLAIEQSLNSVYRECRVSDKSIGLLEIRVVKRGTFDELMDYAIKGGASMSQYKTPRCVKLPLFVDLLNSRVTASFSSRKPPKWHFGRDQWFFENNKE
eukprot:Gb_31647 [translate_table: standard]